MTDWQTDDGLNDRKSYSWIADLAIEAEMSISWANIFQMKKTGGKNVAWHAKVHRKDAY
jgi:hypothetical protein